MTPAVGPVARWRLAARPRTLLAAAVPVALGVSITRPARLDWLNAALCLVVALTLQVGTNYANDYSDGVRGTDEERVGPFRLTASKLVAAKAVRRAALGAYALAGVAGLWLSARTSWWLLAIGVSAVLAGWCYTGGPRPYGYLGLGELFVFLYFGLVATVGSAYAQHGEIPARAWWLGVVAGSMACALLEANNLRDVEGDRKVGKLTLAARLGRRRASWLYALFVVGVALGVVASREAVVLVLVALCYAAPTRLAFSPRAGGALLPMLRFSARAQLLVGAALVALLATTRLWG